jgi:hypothetical protein
MNNICTQLEVYDKKTGTCIPAPRLKNACKKGVRDPVTGYCPGYPKGATTAVVAVAMPPPPSIGSSSALANLAERVDHIEQQLVALVGRRSVTQRSAKSKKSAVVVRSSSSSSKSPSVVAVRDKTRRRMPLRVAMSKKRSMSQTLSSSSPSSPSSSSAMMIRNKTRRLVPLSFKSFHAPRDPEQKGLLPSFPSSFASSSDSSSSPNPFYMSSAEADAEQARINNMTRSELQAHYNNL